MIATAFISGCVIGGIITAFYVYGVTKEKYIRKTREEEYKRYENKIQELNYKVGIIQGQNQILSKIANELKGK